MVTGLIYGLIALIVGIAIGAGILMLSTRIVAGFTPKFPISAVTVIVEFIAAAIVSWILHLILGASSIGSIIALIVIFLVYAAIINALIKKPDGAQMGFGKACLVTLVEIVIEIILGIILFFVFGAALFGGMMGAAAMH